MANSNTPFGLRPVRYVGGAPYSGAARTYYVPSSDTKPLYIGDVVTLTGTGNTAGTAPVVSLMSASSSSAVTYPTGVVVGVKPADTTSATYKAASTAAYIFVADDPTLLFEAQEDSVGGALAVTAIGNNINIVYAAGSNYTGLSGTMLDSSSAATSSFLPLRLVSVVDSPDNALGNYAKWLVSLANNSTTRTTGV